jgi:hypothetical protein
LIFIFLTNFELSLDFGVEPAELGEPVRNLWFG